MRFTALAPFLAILVLVGCGGSDEGNEVATAPKPVDALRVGLIVDLGQLDDNGFNELAFRGLKRAEKELSRRRRPTTSRT